MWIYENKLYDEASTEHVGFVYLITDLTTNRKYVGKKLFWNTRKLKPLKGKSRRRKQVVESDMK